MGDAGEGLIDATSRIEERMEEMQESRRLSRQGGPPLDPERVRATESLRLARADIERQLATMVHEARRQQLMSALAEINRRLSDFQ
ncbi:MAG: hypothetical protein NTV05_16905 [Acidobacteria bacterium]|nr:hypothetical protein [Acidobacteriota bacterium]